jgi:hypothetical protein
VRVTSVVPDFLAFLAAAADAPLDRRRALWHELYEEPNRDLFDVYYTNWASPKALDAALERFPGEVVRISAGAETLPERVEQAARTTAASLSLPEPDLDVILLVGLFSSDGWVTELRGRRTLFFAASTCLSRRTTTSSSRTSARTSSIVRRDTPATTSLRPRSRRVWPSSRRSSWSRSR